MRQERAEAVQLARQVGIREHEWLEDQYDAIERIVRLVKEAERDAIVDLASKQGWAMKNEDPFEDAVRDICDMRKRSNAALTGASRNGEASG